MGGPGWSRNFYEGPDDPDTPGHPRYREQRSTDMGDGAGDIRGDSEAQLRREISRLEAELAAKEPDYMAELKSAVRMVQDHLDLIVSMIGHMEGSDPARRVEEGVKALKMFDGAGEGYEGIYPKLKKVEQLLPNAVGQAMMETK